jgi:hypothetical protein
MSMVHTAKRDRWVTWMMSAVLGMTAVFGALFLALAVLHAAPPLLFPGLLMAGVTLWLSRTFASTSYEIAPPLLLVRFWPLRWQIPLGDIVEVVPRRGLAVELSWGLAWSMDRLLVHYRKKNGRRALPVAISPRDPVAFLRELTEAEPALEVTDEGTFQLRDGAR